MNDAMPVELHGTYYTTAEAAKVLECTDGRVRQMILANLIDVVHVSDRVKLVPKSEVERVKGIAVTTGRPRKYAQ